MDSCSVSEHVLGKVGYLAFLTEIQSSLRNFFGFNQYIHLRYVLRIRPRINCFTPEKFQDTAKKLKSKFIYCRQ